jgi:hypothetical protein
MSPRHVLLYCVIAVLLNTVIALAWVIWREATISANQRAQIIELQTQLKARDANRQTASGSTQEPASISPSNR